MEIAEFERCINLGLGRAILHLQKHSSEPYSDAILYACLHNTIYDRQVEGGKGEYIYEIIRLSGEESFYRQKIIEGLKTSDLHTYKRDTSHLIDILRCFAQDEDKEARQIIYDLFNASVKTSEVWGDSAIVLIDGFQGFAYVAEKYGEVILEDPEFFDGDTILWIVEEMEGEEIVKAKVEALNQTNDKVVAYLKRIDRYRLPSIKRKSRAKIPETYLSYEELKPILKTQTVSNLHQWGRLANINNLIRAAIDLENETDPLFLKKYLAIFHHRAYPRPPQALFPLTSHKNAQIAAMSFGVLKQMQSPSIREFALDLISKEQNIGRAIGLFERNFEESDWELIEAAAEKKLDEFDYHNIQFAVRDVFEAHPSPKAIKSLLNLYEYGVCSHCRFRILEHLVSLDALPESIREECFHDSNNDIREWAKKGFLLEPD